MGCGATGKRKDPIATQRIGTYEEFFEEIAKGRKLIVYEDVVLDVGKYAALHPGGAETVNSCIGTWCYSN